MMPKSTISSALECMMSKEHEKLGNSSDHVKEHKKLGKAMKYAKEQEPKRQEARQLHDRERRAWAYPRAYQLCPRVALRQQLISQSTDRESLSGSSLILTMNLIIGSYSNRECWIKLVSDEGYILRSCISLSQCMNSCFNESWLSMYETWFCSGLWYIE